VADEAKAQAAGNGKTHVLSVHNGPRWRAEKVSFRRQHASGEPVHARGLALIDQPGGNLLNGIASQRLHAIGP